MQLIHCATQGFFDQIILGFEMGVETTMGQPQCLHQRLQTGCANTVPTKARGGFVKDALMGLGFVIFGVTH
jgi:hypothetical protein